MPKPAARWSVRLLSATAIYVLFYRYACIGNVTIGKSTAKFPKNRKLKIFKGLIPQNYVSPAGRQITVASGSHP